LNTYWRNLWSESVGKLAEAAIAHSAYVERDVLKNPGRMKAHNCTVVETADNLEALIAAVPDSDILRAEGLAFRFQNIANGIGDAKLIERANEAMRSVRARAAYKRLVTQRVNGA
jgi:hypothetical protein